MFYCPLCRKNVEHWLTLVLGNKLLVHTVGVLKDIVLQHYI